MCFDFTMRVDDCAATGVITSITVHARSVDYQCVCLVLDGAGSSSFSRGDGKLAV